MFNAYSNGNVHIVGVLLDTHFMCIYVKIYVEKNFIKALRIYCLAFVRIKAHEGVDFKY